MKTTDITIESFKKYVGRVKCITLLHYKDVNDMKLKEIARALKSRLEDPDEVKGIGMEKLVWYVDNKGERVFWNQRNARNLTVEEQAGIYAKSGLDDRMSHMLDSLRQGLTMDVEIINIHDTLINETVIVDGVLRAVALYYLYANEKNTLKKLLKSKHSIYLIDLISPAAALLFPYDFLNICRDLKPGT
jgi:hypothetical protein